MNDIKQAVLNVLDSEHLPVLSADIPFLLQTLSDESIDMKQLSVTIEYFPTIAARLIALANSVWSSPVTPVTTLEMAMSRLGFGVVVSTSIALAVASPFDPSRCPSFDVSSFWCRSLLASHASYQLAEATKKELSPETARTAGLLHNLGLLMLADQLPQETHQILQHQRDSPASLGQLMFNKLGFDYADAGAILTEEWGLPIDLVMAIAEHRRPNKSCTQGEYACIVNCAITMAQAAAQHTAYTIPDSLSLSLEISPEVSEQIFTQLNTQLMKIRKLAETLFTS